MSNRTKTTPWFYAQNDGRSYITPEDIASAVKAGASRPALYAIVLLAISRKECNDWSLCAFVTLNAPYKRRTK